MAAILDITANLCNLCDNDIPSCPAFQTDLQYGIGEGNDNVVECPFYQGPFGTDYGVIDANPSSNGNI